RLSHVAANTVQKGRESKQYAAQESHCCCKGQHLAVQTNFCQSRESSGSQCAQQAHAAISEKQRKSTAERSQQYTLSQDQAGYPGTARAQRGPDAHLAVASACLCDLEICHVDHRNHQDKNHCAEQQQQRSSHLAYERGFQWLGPCGVKFTVRELPLYFSSDGREIGPGLGFTHTGLEPSDG